jgi:glycosyltransferase involved in cell wall biosynthesis
MKGKIGEYLSCGLPCVTTSIGAEGMNLHDGVEALVADDAVAFANHVIDVYTNHDRWQILSENGPLYIQKNLSPAAIRISVDEALRRACNDNVLKRNSSLSHATNRILRAVRILSSKFLP